MKNLKYEGMVESKIFWRLRGLETGLSGFKLKEYIMVNFCYKLFGTNLISLKPNAALFFPSHKTTDSPSFLHYQFFSFSSSSPFGLPSPKKLINFVFPSPLLHGAVKLNSDLCLEVVLWPWLFRRRRLAFPAKNVRFEGRC